MKAFLIAAAILIFASPAMSHDWPQSGINTLFQTCRQHAPADGAEAGYSMAAFCTCVTDKVPATIRWSDFRTIEQRTIIAGVRSGALKTGKIAGVDPQNASANTYAANLLYFCQVGGPPEGTLWIFPKPTAK